MLETYGFLQKFIRMIRGLYRTAETATMVNGVIPKLIKVKRGVRQGDPMSCLLYNLAIEPLACAIRQSKTLKGYKVNRMNKLITKLFADDTLVYLNKKDKIKDLEEIIKEFCMASTAKFNMEKNQSAPNRKLTLQERTNRNEKNGR